MLTITINQTKYPIQVEQFGHGDIPIIVCGPGEIYGKLLKQSLISNNFLKDYCFFSPKLYWCKDSPLTELPNYVVNRFTLNNLCTHLEEVRMGLIQQGLLSSEKVGVYGHSGFSALAFYYAMYFQKNTLFVEAEAPVPYLVADEWKIIKEKYFTAMASKERKEALHAQRLQPGDSAIGEENLKNFISFRDAYHKMNALLWYDFETDHRNKVWGNEELNMIMFRHYFQILLANYDVRLFEETLDVPVHISLGIFDTIAPPPAWIDSLDQGGINFFTNRNRRYDIFKKSGHWPATEEPEKYGEIFKIFVDSILK
jgi:pimeloyl-ACP methyl ester carboxylesterase